MVALGAGTVATGTVVGAMGMSVAECDLRACKSRRRTFSFVGMSLVGVGASFGLGPGLSVWAKERRDGAGPEGGETLAFVGGAMSFLGTGAMVIGATLTTFPIACDDLGGPISSCEYGLEDGLTPPAATGVFVAGVVAFGVGIPLWVLAQATVPRRLG